MRCSAFFKSGGGTTLAACRTDVLVRKCVRASSGRGYLKKDLKEETRRAFGSRACFLNDVASGRSAQFAFGDAVRIPRF
jgi:hypothetical protein